MKPEREREGGMRVKWPQGEDKANAAGLLTRLMGGIRCRRRLLRWRPYLEDLLVVSVIVENLQMIHERGMRQGTEEDEASKEMRQTCCHPPSQRSLWFPSHC